jgi:hypothetical protein
MQKWILKMTRVGACAGVFLSLAGPCLTASSMAQPPEQSILPPAPAPLELLDKLAEGEFSIEPSGVRGEFEVTIRNASLLAVLRALAQKDGRTLLVSDELEHEANKILTGVGTWTPLTIDRAFEWGKRISAEKWSWGKVGPSTYLIVRREISKVEKEAGQQALQEILDSIRKKREEKEKAEAAKQAPDKQPPLPDNMPNRAPLKIEFGCSLTLLGVNESHRAGRLQPAYCSRRLQPISRVDLN